MQLLYALVLTVAHAGTVAETYPPPPGASRVPGDAFATHLAGLPLLDADRPIRTHDGRTVHHHGHVIDLPMVSGDLQQCADSILRVRAEFLRARGEDVLFHATSGDPMPWSRYRDGERARDVGNKLAWSTASPASWDTYLTALFLWAGTASLAAHDTVADDTPHPGDLLVQGGFPGHAVLLLDVATRDDATYVLIAEGFMPAQEFHIELGPHAGWWLWDDGVRLPHWDLPEKYLRTWPSKQP